MREYKLYMDGKFVDSKSARVEDTLNPFDGSVVARFWLDDEEGTRRCFSERAPFGGYKQSESERNFGASA